MIKKKSNAQNIVIIVLCILLVVSIGFGVTYSYYNGRTDLVKGVITTANLAIELDNDTDFTKAEFFLSTHVTGSVYAPGDDLDNAALNIYNKCKMETYMVIVYSLSAHKTDDESIKIDVSNTPAVTFDLSKVHQNTWKPIDYACENTNATYTCLVGINEFPAWAGTTENGNVIEIIQSRALKIPGDKWGNELQGCTVTISVRAYAVQAKGLGAEYFGPIQDAQEKYQQTSNQELKAQALEEKAQAIANAVLEICGVDAQ